MTRVQIIVLFLIAAALLGETQASNAQSAYSYPWCAISGGKDAGSLTCYYTSREQCMTTQGIGGNCIESPYYHAQSAQLPRRAVVKQHHRRHA
jgi:Protein of unknown function (DUF3551)